MDVKYINPFIEAFNNVMPQLGFGAVNMGELSVRGKEMTSSGVVVLLGIVGAVRGNVVYTIDVEAAKQIASVMMCETVEELDEMSCSALSELTNMLTANAATAFSNSGIAIDISTPTMLQGDNITINMSSELALSIKLLADDIPVEICISFEG